VAGGVGVDGYTYAAVSCPLALQAPLGRPRPRLGRSDRQLLATSVPPPLGLEVTGLVEGHVEQVFCSGSLVRQQHHGHLDGTASNQRLGWAGAEVMFHGLTKQPQQRTGQRGDVGAPAAAAAASAAGAAQAQRPTRAWGRPQRQSGSSWKRKA
jgi:hypothetical protein